MPCLFRLFAAKHTQLVTAEMRLIHLLSLGLLHLIFTPANVLCINTGTSYDQVFQWSPHYQQQHTKTLKTLQRLHNSSAILHFIELTHNFTAKDLAKCHRVSLVSLNFSVNAQSYHQFDRQADIATRTSNLLTNLFSSDLYSNVSLQHLISNKSFYWSLLLANLQSDPKIFAAGISFSNVFLKGYSLNLKHFTPYIYRNASANDTVRTILSSHNYLAGENPSEVFHSDWYWKFAFANYSSVAAQWLGSAANHDYGVWSSPYLDCGITKTWLITYVVPFFKVNPPNTDSQSTLV